VAALATHAWAQQGGQVVQGGATITNPNSTTTQINQTTDRTVINWNSFSIASGNQVIFSQPSSSSVALNRVVGQDPSVILGHLEANGQVFLLNPNGILFGQTATVNTGGFVASTLSMADSDFMLGNYHLTQDPTKPLSYVVNQGSINATQYAALVAPLVENSGSIIAPGGQIYLLASSEVLLTTNGNSLIGYSIGNVAGGTVVIRPDALSDAVRAVVNTAGLVEAGSVVNNPDGTISLVGASGTLVNSGTVSTKGIDGGKIVLNSAQSNVLTSTSQILSDAGSVELSCGGSFILEGIFNALSPSGAKGSLIFDPINVTIIQSGAGSYDGSFNITPNVSAILPFGFDPGGSGTVSEAQIHTLSQSLFTITIQATNQIAFQTVGGGYTYFSGPGLTLAPPVDLVLSAGGGGIFSDPSTSINMGPFNRLILQSTGGVSMGPIITPELVLLGSGFFNLYSGVPNQIGSLAANINGPLEVLNSGNLTIANLPGRAAPLSGLGADGISTGGGTFVLLQTQNGGITVNAPISNVGGTTILEAGNTGTATSITVNPGGSISSNEIDLVADNMSLQGPLFAPGGLVQLFPWSGTTTISLGGADGPTTLGLSAPELNEVTASVLRIESFGNGTISLDAPVAPTGTTTLALVTAGSVVDTTNVPGPHLTIQHLAITAGTGIGLATDPLAVASNGGIGLTLAFQNGSNGVFISDQTLLGFGQTLTIGPVDTLGSSSNGGPMTQISTYGRLTVAGGGISTPGTLSLTTLGGGTQNGNMNINAPISAGNLILSSADDINLSANITVPGAARIVADTDNLDGGGIRQFGGAINIGQALLISRDYQESASFGAIELGFLGGTFNAGSLQVVIASGGTHSGPLHSLNFDIVNQGPLVLQYQGALLGPAVGIFGDAITAVGITTTSSGVPTTTTGSFMEIWTTSGNLTLGVNGGPSGSIDLQNGGFFLAAGFPATTNLFSLAPNSNSYIHAGYGTIEADRMDLTGGKINVGGGSLGLEQMTAGWGINLGSTVDTSPNQLELSQQEISNITAGIIYFGKYSAAGGAIEISAPINFETNNFPWVALQSGSTITEDAASPLTVFALSIRSLGATTLMDPNNHIRFFEANVGGALNLYNADIFSIHGFLFTNGIESSGNPVSITVNNGSIGIDSPIDAVGSTVTLQILTDAPGNWIGNFAGGQTNIRTSNAILLSQEGIGNANIGNGALLVQVDNLQAINQGAAGDIVIHDQSNGLNLGSLTANPNAVQNSAPGGLITISTIGGPLNVFNPVLADGSISLTANATGAFVNNVTVHSDIVSANGNITIQAANSIVLDPAVDGGTQISAPNGRITLQAAQGSPDLGGSLVQLSGAISAKELVVEAENGIDLGNAGTLTVQRLQASNDGANPTGSINITNTGSNLELVNMSGSGFSLLNATSVGGGNITVKELGGTLTVTNNVFAVDNISLSSNLGVPGDLTDNACIMTINGSIQLDGTAYPVPGANGNVVLGPNSCFDILGPADYVLVSCNGNTPVNINGTIDVTGKIIILSEGDININGSFTFLRSATGVLLVADWAGCDPSDGIGAIHGNTDIFAHIQSNNITLQAGSGIFLTTSSYNPGDTASIQALNTTSGGINIVHQGLALITQTGQWFDPGKPGLQNLAPAGGINFTDQGDLTVGAPVQTSGGPILITTQSTPSYSGIVTNDSLISTVSGTLTINAANYVWNNTGTISSTSGAITLTGVNAFYNYNLISNTTGTITADASGPGGFFYISGSGTISSGSGAINLTSGGALWNYGHITSTTGSINLTTNGSGQYLYNAGTISSTNGVITLIAQTGSGDVIWNDTPGIIQSGGHINLEVSGSNDGVFNGGTVSSTGSYVYMAAFGTNSYVENVGTVTAQGEITFQAYASGDALYNFGQMTSTGSDIFFYLTPANGYILNAGTLTSNLSGVELEAVGANAFVQNTGKIICNGGTIEADRIDLHAGSSITVHDFNYFSLLPATAGRLIDLGSTVDTTPNTLELSNAELNTIQVGFGGQNYRLNIGGFTIFGGTSTAGAINISAPINVANTGPIGALILDTASTITQAAGAALVVPNHLVLYSGDRTTHNGGNVTLTDPGNNVLQITANVGGDLNYVDQDVLSIAQFGGSGIFSNNHNVTITTLNGPIQFGLNGVYNGTYYGYGGGTINAGTGTVRLTAEGPQGAIDRVNSGTWDIIANQAILVADAGIGQSNYLFTQLNQLQAINNGVTANTFIQIYNVASGGLTVQDIDPGVSTFGLLNNSAGFGLVSLWQNNGPLTIASPVQSATGWVWLYAVESSATNNDLHVKADVKALQDAVYLWAGDNILIGEGGTSPTISAKNYMEIEAGYGDTDNIAAVTQLGGAITSPILRTQASQGISLGVNGTLSVGELRLINMALTPEVNSNSAPTGNVVINNIGDLVLTAFQSGLAMMSDATGAGQGNLSITTTGALTVNVPVFATRSLVLNGSSIQVNQILESVTGPITLNGVNYPVSLGGGIGSVHINAGGGTQVLSPGVAPSLIVILNDRTESNYTYTGGSLNVPGSIIILSEGGITIPSGTTLQSAGGIVFLADWNMAIPNGQGAISMGAGSALVSNYIALGAASGISATTESLTPSGTTLFQIQNTTSGDIQISHTGNANIITTDPVNPNLSLPNPFVSGTPGLSNTGGGGIFFSTTLDTTFNANVQTTAGGLISLTAGGNLIQGNIPNTSISTTGKLILSAGGSIGTGDLDGASTTHYLDLSLGGIGTVQVQAGGNIFLKEVEPGIALSTSQISLTETSGASHIVGLSSLTGNVNIDSAFGGGTADIVVTGQNINFLSGGILSASDRIHLISAGAITQAANSLVQSDQLVLSAVGNITLPETQVKELQVLNGGNVAITNTGDVVLTSILPGNAVTVTGSFSLTAMSSITVAAPVVAGSVALTADDSILVLTTGPIQATSGAIALTAEHGSITINADSTAGAFLRAAGDISLSAGTTINVSDQAASPTFTLLAGGQIDLMSQGATTLQAFFKGQNINVQSFGNLTVTGFYQSTGGEVDFFTPAVFASNATYEGFSGVRIQGIHGVSLFGGNGAFLSSGGPVQISAPSGPVLVQENVTGTSVSITAGTTVEIDHPVTGTAGVAVTAGGTITLNNEILAPGQLVTLTSSTGAIVDGLAPGAVNVVADHLTASAPEGITLNTVINSIDANSTGGNITITNQGNLFLTSFSAPVGTATITLTGAGSSITGGTLIAQDAVLTVPGNIFLNTTLETLTATSTGGSIFITETDDLALKTVSAPGDVVITAGGAITDAGGVTVNVIADFAMLSAAKGIGTLSDPIKTQVSILTLQNTTSGDVAVVNQGFLSLETSFNHGGAFSLTNLGGWLTLNGDIQAQGNVTLSISGGEVDFGGSITAGGNISVSADQGIILNDSTGLTLAAGGNLTLSSSAGSIASDSNIFVAGGRITVLAGSGGFFSTSDQFTADGGITVTSVGGYSSQSSTFQAGGDIAIQTTGGSLSSLTDTFTAGGKITFTSSGLLGITGDGVTTTLNATGPIVLSSGSSLSLTDAILQSGGQVRLTSGGSISQTGNIIGTSLVAQAVSGIQLGDISVPAVQATNTGSNDIEITSTGDLALSDLDSLGWAIRNAGGAITVNSPGTIKVNSVVNAGTSGVVLNAGGAIIDGNGPLVNVIGNSAFLTAATSIDLDTQVGTLWASLTAGGGSGISIRQAGSLAIGNVNALGAPVSITLSSGTLTDAVGAATPNVLGGAVTLIAPGGINLDTQVTSLSAQSVNSDITIRQTGSLILDLISAGSGTVTLTSTGALIDGNGTANNIDAYRAVLAATGGIGSLANPLDTTVSHLLLTNTGAGGITLVNTGSLTLEGAQAGTGALSLTVQGGSFTGQGTITAAGGITLSASGDLSLQSAAAATGGALVLTSGGNLTLVGSDLTSNTRTTLTAAGSVVQTGGLVTGDQLVVTAATGINLPDTSVNVLQATNTLSGNLLVYNNRTLTLQDLTGLGWAVNNLGGGVDIEVGGPPTNDIFVNSPVLSAGSIHLEADLSVFVNASLTAGTNITLIANSAGNPITGTGGIFQEAGVITAQSLTLSAGGGIGPLTTSVQSVDATNTGTGDISITNAGTLSVGTVSAAKGNVTLTVLSGALVDGNGAGVNVSGNAAFLTAPGGIDLDTAVASITATTQDHDITLRQTGNLALDGLTAGRGNVYLTVVGDVTNGTGGEGANVTANTLTIVATGAIGGPSGGLPLDLSVNAIDLQSTIAGPIGITNSGPLDVLRATTMSGPINITAFDGDLTVNNVQARGAGVWASLIATTGNIIQTPGTSVSAPGEVVLTAGQGILLSLVNAGTTASITASGGSILDNDELSGLGDGLNIKTGGNATVSATGTIGTATNCIDVQIGGTLFASAGASSGGISMNFCGTTANGAFQIVGPTPPGIIIFNGLTNGLGNDFNGTLNLFNLLDSERRFDIYSQYPLVNSEIFIPVPLDDEREKKKDK
jgi:filamentous hemagglutinin family protein